MTRPILIAGPTASGKSALAVRLAARHDGVIVNADSMQVYRELAVLTARPSAADLAAAPHLLYGHVAGGEGYSAGRYVKEAGAAIAHVQASGRTPIVVGGTGLYFKALLDGLSPIPEIPAEVRASWRAKADRVTTDGLHALLAARDRVMARRLPPGDTQRILRALEVIDATGRSLADWQREPGVPTLRAEDATLVVVGPEREALYARCDARFDAMMARGALEEVGALMALDLDPDLPIMGALGVRPLALHLERRLSFDDAVERGRIETRQYAKRQLTWLRKHMVAWKWLEMKDMDDFSI